MQKEELEIFYRLDQKKYLVQYNKTLRRFLKDLEICYPEEDIQAFINKLIAWYNVKYSDKYIDKERHEQLDKYDLVLISMMSLEQLQQKLDTLELELFSSERKEMIIFRKYLVEMAGCGLIYSRQSNPSYGYYRVQKMFSEWNQYFDWNLNEQIYDIILRRDYSPHDEDVIRLLERKKRKEAQTIKKEKPYLRSLRRFKPFH